MLSYNDLKFSLDLKPQPLPFAYLAGVLAFSVLLFIVIASITPYLLPIYCVYLYFVFHCYQFFVLLTHPQSAREMSCQKGCWEVSFYNAQSQKDLVLKHYYLSAIYILLHFEEKESVLLAESSLVFSKARLRKWIKPRKSIMIMPSQVGEEGFRSLYRLLKFQNKALFAD